MNDLPAVRLLLRLIVNPGWAPIAVIVLHLTLAEFGLTDRLDHLLHFLGGASISYFLYRLIASLPSHSIRKPLHYLLAFTSACTAAVFWEFAEFASDRFLNTTIQQTLPETVLDLLFGVLGAAATLLLFGVFHLLIRK
jgi:hypothetical protein